MSKQEAIEQLEMRLNAQGLMLDSQAELNIIISKNLENRLNELAKKFEDRLQVIETASKARQLVEFMQGREWRPKPPAPPMFVAGDCVFLRNTDSQLGSYWTVYSAPNVMPMLDHGFTQNEYITLRRKV